MARRPRFLGMRSRDGVKARGQVTVTGCSEKGDSRTGQNLKVERNDADGGRSGRMSATIRRTQGKRPTRATGSRLRQPAEIPEESKEECAQVSGEGLQKMQRKLASEGKPSSTDGDVSVVRR